MYAYSEDEPVETMNNNRPCLGKGSYVIITWLSKYVTAQNGECHLNNAQNKAEGGHEILSHDYLTYEASHTH